MTLNMHEVVGKCDIVLLTMDTLRFDVAEQQMQKGNLPELSKHFKQWQKRHSPGSFTYAAHQALFAGFFPTPFDDPLAERLFAVDFIGSSSTGKHTKIFNSATIVEGLADVGYRTICVGGVGFFNKQNPLGSAMPDLFEQSVWRPELGVTNPDSTFNQVAKAIELVGQSDQNTFLFINISAMHQPNRFYLEGCEKDTIESHAAALRYVDKQLAPLFEYFGQRRNTLFIICSDHGTCYGENGYSGHRLAHEVVWTVPYAEFIQQAVQ